MATLITDPALERRLRAERVELGADRYDEVWEGIYMMAPMPDNEHQPLVARFTRIFEEVIGDAGLGNVLPLSFQLRSGQPRPRSELQNVDTARVWTI